MEEQWELFLLEDLIKPVEKHSEWILIIDKNFLCGDKDIGEAPLCVNQKVTQDVIYKPNFPIFFLSENILLSNKSWHHGEVPDIGRRQEECPLRPESWLRPWPVCCCSEGVNLRLTI